MRICAHPGCPTPVERPGANRCPTHDPGPRTRLDRTPPNPGVPAQLRRRIYQRDNGICRHCGRWCPPTAYHADHWPTPRSAGGPTTPDNLVVACPTCNERHGRRLGADTTNRTNGYYPTSPPDEESTGSQVRNGNDPTSAASKESTGRAISTSTFAGSHNDSAASECAAATGVESSPPAQPATGPQSESSSTPPHLGEVRDSDIYATDDHDIAHEVRDWAIANATNPRYRIVLAGYHTEHDHIIPDTWRRHRWTGSGSQSTAASAARQDGNHTNRALETLWMSPGCLDDTQGNLFT